jgi:hypothetical protein
MLFRLLKLAYIDVEAKIAEIKAEIAERIGQGLQHVTRKARTTAVVAGLFLCAALMVLFLLIVGLIALYKWGEIRYGMFIGLALDAVFLAALAGILVACALWIANREDAASRTTSGKVGPARLPPPDPSSTGSPYQSSFRSSARPQDLIEPLFALLGRYVPAPVTGQPAIDQMLDRISARAQATTDEVVDRAAALVRHGDRATMLSVLGAAALLGWLMARAVPEDKARLIR